MQTKSPPLLTTEEALACARTVAAAEEKAAHAAIETFLETLQRELEALGDGELLELLANTEHIHYSVACDHDRQRGCIVKYTIEFQKVSPYRPPVKD